LALAIVVETGGAGARHLADYGQLDAIIDALVGGVEHRVAVIGFDSAPHLLKPFAPDLDVASRQLANLREGDPGGAVLDGVVFAVEQLRAQPARYRRAVLLLSETIDHGSRATTYNVSVSWPDRGCFQDKYDDFKFTRKFSFKAQATVAD
jgi:hypothetical protein